MDVAGWPVCNWLYLFHDCYEFVPNGSIGTIEGRKDRCKMLGHYHRLEWPSPGGVLKQDNITTQVLQIIANAYHDTQMQGVKING